MNAQKQPIAHKSRHWKTNLIAIFIALLILAGVSGISFVVWQKMGQVSLGMHGWLALIAGVLGTILLGCGLMALSFYSSRSGHDDKAWTDPQNHRDLFK